MLPAVALLALAGCNQVAVPKAAPSPKPVVAAKPKLGTYQVTLYRGVRTLPGTNNIDWSRNSFGVGGNPPVLTLFDNMTPAGGMFNPPPCWVGASVVVQGNFPPVPGSVAALAMPNPGVGGANPGPWTVQFDNNPAGHWSITKTAIINQPTSNNVAGTMAGVAFQALAASGGATVLNGTNLACAP